MSNRTEPLYAPRAFDQWMQSHRVHPTNVFMLFEPGEIEQSIPARFEQQVDKYPDRTAVKSGTHADLRYAQSRCQSYGAIHPRPTFERRGTDCPAA
jgi:hypothetical protein